MFIGIIPARYASTRFPGKPLALIQGKPMIQHVYEQAKKCTMLNRLLVATDDSRIETSVLNFGGEVIMTSEKHNTGTERCAEAITKIDGEYDVVINIQGDEPFILPEQIETLCNCFKHSQTAIATMRKKITDSKELFNPNVVKVVLNENEEAMYFSRSPIPFIRNKPENEWLNSETHFKHIGIYGYQTSVLKKIVTLASNHLEEQESLEQLRWLANGFTIKTALTSFKSIAIDTPADLLEAESFYNRK